MKTMTRVQRHNKKTRKVFSVSLSEAENRELEKMATETRISKSKLVQQGVRTIVGAYRHG